MIKHPFGSDQTLLVRALNATRQTYLPSYVGLRLIGSQLPKGENDFLERMLIRRLNAGEQWRYKGFNMYKGSTNTGQVLKHEYRNCLAPSPLTSLAESAILMILSKIPAFSSSPRAYSYRWPASERAGVSYQYFVEGYKQRNNDVAKALETPNHVAVITDIRSFYPSATKDQVQRALAGLFETSDAKFRVDQDSITSFYARLLDVSGLGIPIGPASGHVLGHLVLREFDNELTSAYGNKYFRYVDDIVVVCPASQEQQVKNHIRLSLHSNGFTTNEEKTITVDDLGWTKNLIQEDVPDIDSFRAFTRDLAVYLALHPSRANELKTMFYESGFSIPIDRLGALSSYPRFRYFLTRRKTQQGLAHALDIWLSTNASFVKRAARIKNTYENSLIELVSSNEADLAANEKRWQAQRVRRIVNALFYLRNFDDWPQRSEAFDAFPELVEQSSLAKALATGTVNPILPFYGRGPAAFAELWNEHGVGEAKLEPLGQVDDITLDGIAVLRLSGTLSESSVSEKTGEAKLSGITSDKSPLRRRSPDLTFEDELESLRLGRSGDQIAQLVKTRYSTAEGTTLDALSLLSSEYRS
jgi:hypothetical protein